MSGLPHFPISGGIISSNVTADRISLVNNTVGNKYFAQGQYVFFVKNSSVWYKYKTATTSWTNEFLWVANAIQQNTKFDANGYPMTTYVSGEDGSVKLNYYDAFGNFLTNTLAVTGYLPTLAINDFDTYLFWVPPNFTNFLQFANLSENFSIIRNYALVAPGQIQALQIELIPNKSQFLFTLEIDTETTQKVYIAFSNSFALMYTYDIQAFLSFVQGILLGENFVVGEKSFKDILNLFIAGTRENIDTFAIQDGLNSFNLTLVQNAFEIGPEYFVISEKQDLDIITEVLMKCNFKDNFGVQEPNTFFALQYISQTNGTVSEYFVVSEISAQALEQAYTLANSNNQDIFYITDNLSNATDSYLQSATTSNIADSDELQLSDLFPIFDLQNYVLSNNTFPKIPEFIVLFDKNDDNSIFNTNIVIVEANLPAKDYIVVSEEFLNKIFINVQPTSNSVKENLVISEIADIFNLYDVVHDNFSEMFNVEEIAMNYAINVYNHVNYFQETLEMKELLQNVVFYPNLEESFPEQLNINFVNVIQNLFQTVDKYHIKENFYIKEPQSSTALQGNFDIYLPKNAGIYQFGVPTKAIQGYPVVTFSSNTNTNVVSYYYYLDTSVVEYYRGPLDYNVNIAESKVSYRLDLVR